MMRVPECDVEWPVRKWAVTLAACPQVRRGWREPAVRAAQRLANERHLYIERDVPEAQAPCP